MIPVMVRNLLESIALTASASTLFAQRAVAGLQANAERCLELALKSDAMVTSLNPLIGYDKAAALVKESHKLGRTILELARERKILPPDVLEKALDPRRMTEPGG